MPKFVNTTAGLVMLATAALALSGTLQAKGTGRIFISNERDHTVTVLDGETLEVIKVIPVGRRPRDMQWNDDKSKLYVAASDVDMIQVIDLDKLEVVEEIFAGDDPEMFEISPDGTTIVASNEDEDMASFIDIESEKIFRQVPTGVEPEGVNFTADGSQVWVTAEVSQMVHVMDTKTGDVYADILVGNRPRRAVFSPDGKEYWLANEITGDVHVIDTATFEVIEKITFEDLKGAPGEVSPVGITMTGDGKTVFTTLGYANRLAVIDRESRKVREYLLVGTRAWNTQLTRDNKLLYVVNSGSDDITIVDVEKEKVIRTVPVGRYPHTLRIDD
jgi:PQQ-dependent catabolism-associated beta-propeller protein